MFGAAKLEHHLAAVHRICSEASFYVWHNIPKNASLEEVELAKAKLPVRQPAHILPWLFVGDVHDAELLKMGKLKHCMIAAVLTLCSDTMNSQEGLSLAEGLAAHGFSHFQIDAQDSETYDLADAVQKALEFVRPFYYRKEPVLVHCFGGINRAAVISVALLMLLDRLPLCIAVRFVVRYRGKVLTNLRFRAQLVQLAEKEGLLGPMSDASFLDPAPAIPQTAPPASWKTSNGTRLLQLVLLSLQTGRGEEQLDSKGYTLRQWEEWYKNNGSEADAEWMASRAEAVRQSWQQRYLAHQSG